MFQIFLSDNQHSPSWQRLNCWFTIETRLRVHLGSVQSVPPLKKSTFTWGSMQRCGPLWSAAASITRFVCDFDVDVSGRVPQDRRLSWSVWMWPLSATSWSRCSETAAILHFQLGWRIPTALSQRRAVTAALRRPVGCHVTGGRIPSGQW